MIELPDRVRLPIAFDPEPLRAALARIDEEAWEPHFNTQQYAGDWSGVALRVGVGSPLALYPDPSRDDFADTELLAAGPELRAALARFECPLRTVRLLRLGPGATITDHRDHALSFAHGEARLHVPILSGPAVTFRLDGAEVPMRPGECWYLDLTRTHRVHNAGDEPRVHLVVDCEVNAWLTAELLEGVGSGDTGAPIT